METKKTIDTLNELIEINNDRIQGYERASENIEEKELKSLFLMFEQTSKECLEDLKNEIIKLGGEVNEGKNISGKFFRTWMDVKSALTGKNRNAILNSCEYGEEHAKETYQTVMNDSEHLSPKHLTMVKEQYNLLKSDRSTIKSMQNTLVVAQ